MINFLAKLNPNFIEIGDFSIKWYAVCILIGVVICYITVVHLFKKAGFKQDVVDGALLVGESGIGKSEIALELVKKGHRLVADDSVIVSAANRKLYGKAPSPLKGFLEVRGLGIINVIQMFGVVSIRNSKHVSLIISLEKAENVKSIDRLLNKVDSKNILGLDIPLVRLPVSEGRSMSYLVEVATINYRMKQNGYDATKEFARLYDVVVEGEENND